jgi:hypothetical protein
MLYKLYFIFFLLLSFSLVSCEYFHSNPIKSVNIYSGKYLDLMKNADEDKLDEMQNIVISNHLNLNYADSKHGVSLLNWCLINNKEKSFEKLLQLGANPNWQDFYCEFAPTITESAAVEPSNYLKLCLKYSGNPNILTKQNQSFLPYQSPLFAAVSTGGGRF